MAHQFKVTIYDRKNNRAQEYEVDRIVALLCMPFGTGEGWTLALRGLNKEQLAEAIAVLLDRVFDLAGPECLDQVSGKLGRVPQEATLIDYTKDGR